MSDDLVSKRRAERCRKHSNACDCREYEHAQEIERLRAENDALRARIEGALVLTATRNGVIRTDPNAFGPGQRVALVVVND